MQFCIPNFQTLFLALRQKKGQKIIENNQPIFDWNKFQNFFLYLLIQANAFLHRAKPSILIFRNFSDAALTKKGHTCIVLNLQSQFSVTYQTNWPKKWHKNLFNVRHLATTKELNKFVNYQEKQKLYLNNLLNQRIYKRRMHFGCCLFVWKFFWIAKNSISVFNSSCLLEINKNLSIQTTFRLK